MSRPRGRPAKECPAASDESVRAIKRMLRGKEAFKDAKARCMLLPKKRPTMMRKLNLNTEAYDVTGRIEYDRELTSRIHPDDRKYMELYENSMRTVWILEHGVASITDERTRAIAEDTLLKGIPVMKLLDKYKLGRTQIFWEKENAIRFVASFMERAE